MGVQGLWDLASPAGQRVNFQALENKVVAVDASIWMYHFLKAMRDEKGDMVKGAHLIGFFRRICKLLYLKIRPVFVFDGPPPALKWKTLQLRAKQRDSEERMRRKAVERLLRNQLQQHLLRAAQGDAPAEMPPAEDPEPESQDPEEDADDADDAVAVEPGTSSRAPRTGRLRRTPNAVPEAFRGFMAQRRHVSEVQVPELPEEPLREILQVPNRRPQGRMRQPDEWKGYLVPGGGMVTVPLDGPVALEEFEQLDPKTKYTLLQRAQEAWYGESRLKAVEAKDDMGAFVNVQLEMFLRHIRTNKEIEKVKRSMAESVSRPVGEEMEGEVYRAPSFLQEQVPDVPTAEPTDAIEVDSVIGSKGRGKGKGRKAKRPRQLGGAEPTRWQPLPGVGRSSDPMTWLGEGQEDEDVEDAEILAPSEGAIDAPAVSSAEDLFGAAFFEASPNKRPRVEEALQADPPVSPEMEDVEFFSLEAEEVGAFQDTATGEGRQDEMGNDPSVTETVDLASAPDEVAEVDEEQGNDPSVTETVNLASAPDEVAEVDEEQRNDPSVTETVDLASAPDEVAEVDEAAAAGEVGETFAPCRLAVDEENEGAEFFSLEHADVLEDSGCNQLSTAVPAAVELGEVEEASMISTEVSSLRAEEPEVCSKALPSAPVLRQDEGAPMWKSPRLSEPPQVEPEDGRLSEPPQVEPEARSESAQAAAAVAAARAAPAAAVPGRSEDTEALDGVWCSTHFQYRWRCKQDGVSHSCQVDRAESSNPSGQGRGKGKGGKGKGDVEEAALGDEEMEELEFQRFAAELEDEHQDLRAQARRAKRGADMVTPEMQADVESLLEALGIPFVHAPAEAEAQCAFLAEARLVDAVASDDSDVLVFGAREVYRRMFSEDHQVECYSSARLETRLGLVQDQLIVLAMLLGCDYTLGVHGVGMVNGLEIVRAYSPVRGQGNVQEWLQRLETFRSWAQNVADWGKESAGVEDEDGKAMAEFKRKHTNFRTQWSFPNDFPSAAVMTAFQTPEVDRSLEPFSWATVDVNTVVAKLSEANLSEEKVMERLEPALRRYQDTLRQPRITEYMLPATGDVAVVRSTRMQEALRGLRGESPEGEAVDQPKGRRKGGRSGKGRGRGPKPRARRGRGAGAAFGHLHPGEANIDLDSDSA